MIRACRGDIDFWEKWVAFEINAIGKTKLQLERASANPTYRPQYVWQLTLDYVRLMLRRYSRGDSLFELSQNFDEMLDAWELSNKLASELIAQLKAGEGWDHRHLGTAPLVSGDVRAHNDPRSWVFDLKNLNHYNWCFWLVGLALTLDIPEDQWRRLVALIDAEGQDALLDRVMATRQKNRSIGEGVLHRKPYARLLEVIDAPRDQQPRLLREFVENWYRELARKGQEELWWYIYGDPEKHPLQSGSYFGRWCVEAAVVAKMFNVDDTLCLSHEYYPGDLLRPYGPSTHPARSVPKTSFWSSLFGGKR